jgi:hypothetical protein
MKDRWYSQQSIANLTLLELEELIINLAKKTVREKIVSIQTVGRKLLAETFGSWEDDRTDLEIVKEIYDSLFIKKK